jgi:hypothetical protein
MIDVTNCKWKIVYLVYHREYALDFECDSKSYHGEDSLDVFFFVTLHSVDLDGSLDGRFGSFVKQIYEVISNET